jgi:hypothetical protein
MQVRSALGSLLAGAIAVLLAWPATAFADARSWRDAAGDVGQSPVGSNVYVPVPSRVEGDIVRTRVAHAKRSIWVRVRFRELTTTTNGNFHLVRVRSDRRTRVIEINAFPGHWAGSVTVRNLAGTPVACAVGHRIDYDRNLLALRIPRRCLGLRSEWVRVGVRSTVAGTTYAFADDARTKGTVAPAPRYGPRIYR